MKKKLLALTLAGVMALSLAACGSTEETQEPAASGDGTYTIGICQLVQHDALDAATQGFIDAVKEGLGEENVHILEQNASNDSAACSSICGQFVTEGVDLILANATPALQAAVAATGSIPILGTSVTEYGVAALKGQTLRQRARNLIEIAHPDFRDELKAEYEKRFHCKY